MTQIQNSKRNTLGHLNLVFGICNLEFDHTEAILGGYA